MGYRTAHEHCALMLYLGTLGHTFAYRAEGLPVAFDCVFLGGAAGVGASCLAFRLGERWIVVDAGVRVGAPPDQRLPDLAFLADKDVVAILITHAHADHIGGLPLLRERFPAVPIYASPATIALMRVMFADALRIMARRAAEELEVPLFDDALVAATLRRLRPLPTGTPRVLPGLPSLRGCITRRHHSGNTCHPEVTARHPVSALLDSSHPHPRRPD